MTGSGNLSRNFYKHIKRRGLEARTSLEWDRSIVKMLTAIFSPDVQILDVGCGYGRIAIPLAELGYQIKGLDLSPQLIAEAQEEATKRGLDIEFSVGSMTEMPIQTRHSMQLCAYGPRLMNFLTSPSRLKLYRRCIESSVPQDAQ